MKKIRILIILLLLLFQFIREAYSTDTYKINQKKWYIPDYAKLQFAGNIGLLSTGVGYKIFSEHLYSDFIYGYVPSSISKSEIHIITQKNTFLIFNKNIKKFTLTPIIGHTISFETGNNSFLILPNKYPKDYYSTNAFHFTFFVGGKLHKDFNKQLKFEGLDFYVELGTVDIYLWYKILSKEVRINNIFSTAIGINIYLKNNEAHMNNE